MAWGWLVYIRIFDARLIWQGFWVTPEGCLHCLRGEIFRYVVVGELWATTTQTSNPSRRLLPQHAPPRIPQHAPPLLAPPETAPRTLKLPELLLFNIATIPGDRGTDVVAFTSDGSRRDEGVVQVVRVLEDAGSARDGDEVDGAQVGTELDHAGAAAEGEERRSVSQVIFSRWSSGE